MYFVANLTNTLDANFLSNDDDDDDEEDENEDYLLLSPRGFVEILFSNSNKNRM
jgi:hypothetical protein